jgi:hypothetical protein
METYTYNIETDFPNQQVNVGTLDQEIRDAEGLEDVTLLGVSSDGVNVVVTFEELLSPTQLPVLDAVIAAHQGQALVESLQREVQNSLQTTVSNGWTDALVLVPEGPLKGGTWRLTWHSEISVESGVGGVLVRIVALGAERSASATDLTFWQNYSGTLVAPLGNGTDTTFALQFRAIGGDTARIRRCQLTIVLEESL